VIKLLLMGGLAFSLPPLLLALGSYVYFHTSDEILPGVYLVDQDLSWKSMAEVEQLIDLQWNQIDDIVVIDLDDPGRAWVDQAASFGLTVDATSTAYLAYQQGREGQGFESVLNLFTTLRSGAVIDYVIALDAVMAKAHLEDWAARAFIPAEDDAIALEGREIILTNAKDGMAVDVLASLDLIIKDPFSVRIDHQMIPLVMTTSPSQSYDTQNALESLQRMVNAEFEISAYDPVTDEQFSWSPSDDELPRWIDISLESDGFVVDLRPDQMREFVEGINADLGDGRALESDRVVTNLVAQITGAPQPVEPLIIEYLPSSYVVQPGDNLVSISFKIGLPYWKLYETNPQLASRGLVVGEELVVPPKDDMLSLPVIPEKRIVISLLEQTMWVYEDRELLFEHVVSTGIPNSPTLPGIFQINSHVENAYASIWDLSMPHFLGIYDAVPGLTNGIHGLPLLSSGRRLWADVLGNPASYGCIILDLDAAEHLFYWAEEGVVVEIRE
jgi:LysM repeat protein